MYLYSQGSRHTQETHCSPWPWPSLYPVLCFSAWTQDNKTPHINSSKHWASVATAVRLLILKCSWGKRASGSWDDLRCLNSMFLEGREYAWLTEVKTGILLPTKLTRERSKLEFYSFLKWLFIFPFSHHSKKKKLMKVLERHLSSVVRALFLQRTQVHFPRTHMLPHNHL